jgi:hypothetical protein
MTTLAKIEANHRNGELSTGPRTAEGKVIVSRNATKHGIFATVPVIPGECPATWEAHRAGVVDSLAPVGLLEVNLSERAALLLWRLQRLARYEVETVAVVEKVVVPPLPPPVDKYSHLDPPPRQKTRDEQLRDTRRELRGARTELAELIPAREFFKTQVGADSGKSVPAAVAECILRIAVEKVVTSENLHPDPPRFDSNAFLRKLGLPGIAWESVIWTPELIRRALDVYAGYAGESPNEFADAVRLELEESAEELARKVRRLEGEVNAIVWLLDDGKERPPSKPNPCDGREERIAKYERHLHNLLTSTLHELERLQARREGEAVPPPVVADINVNIENAAG